MRHLVQKIIFKLRFNFLNNFFSELTIIFFKLAGMKIGRGNTLLGFFVNWPHQVKIGNNCSFEHNIFFKFDGIWSLGPAIVLGNDIFVGANCEFNIRKSIIIGDNTLIASGCRFIDHDHGIKLNKLIRIQSGPEKEIVIGEDVWIGCNVVVLKGVCIGNGSVVAAGAVVTKSIPSYEIWGGIPAKKIGNRN